MAEFVDDTLLFEAVLRNLTVLGEAAGRFDRLWTTRYSDAPWVAITGIRHRVVHDYGHVDPEIVWDTVQEDVPAILKKLKRILSDMGSDTLSSPGFRGFHGSIGLMSALSEAGGSSSHSQVGNR